MKKLYSFRADIELLDALREKADKEGTTVSELIHVLLSEALGLGSSKAHSPAIKEEEISPLIAKLKEELKVELKRELLTTPPVDCDADS